MIRYIIYLENETGQKGYHGLIGAKSEYLILNEPDNAVRYASDDDAESALYELEAKYGINREEARIELIADDQTANLELGGNFHDDGISVMEENGERYITVRNAGLEASDSIPPEVADLLVPVLLKIRARLESGDGHQRDTGKA